MLNNLSPFSKNFIASRLQGRTGNMMFQIAHSYAKSLEYNRELVVPRRESSSQHLESTIFRKIPFNIDKTDGLELPRIWCDFEYKEYPPHNDTPTIFCGWFQSEKYFGNYSEPVRSLFYPPIDFLNKVYQIYPFFKDSIVAAINVRRGDYLDQSSRHPTVSLEYIMEAYKHLPPHDKLLIMSDDIEWCKQNISLPNIVFNDNSKFWDGEGLWLLSLCHHFVISNSTFSWWGAWLSKNPNKIVVAPDTWFGPDHELKDQSKDIYCNEWIKIPTKYNEGKIILN